MPFPVQEGIEVRGGCVWLVLCGVCQDELSVLFLFVADGAHEFVALSVDVDDFHIGVIFEETAEFGDVDVHGTCLELSLFHPDGAKGIVALQNVVGILAEECQ